MKIIVPLAFLATLLACSPESDPPEPLLKHHKQALDAAKEAKKLLEESANDRLQKIDQLEQ